jgi:putative ABC transport system ATP-binding protein
MGLFHELHQKGNTIILVTHEEYIAEHAARIIRLKDGLIEKDERVDARKIPNSVPQSGVN